MLKRRIPNPKIRVQFLALLPYIGVALFIVMYFILMIAPFAGIPISIWGPDAIVCLILLAILWVCVLDTQGTSSSK